MRIRGLFAVMMGAVALGGSSAWAQESEYVVSSTNCPVYKFVGKRFRSVSPTQAPKGTVFTGKPVPKRPDLLVTELSDGQYVFQKKCVVAKAREIPKPSTPVDTGIPTGSEVGVTQAKVAGLSRRRASVRRYFSLSYISWQESFKLQTIGGSRYVLRATSLAPCIGGGWTRLTSRQLNLDLGGCFLYGVGDASIPTTGAQPPVTYRSVDARVAGVLVSPGIHWRPEGSHGVTLGLVGTILVKQSSWTAPSTGYQLAGVNALLPGLALESRIERDRYFIMPRVGFFRTLSFYSWSLGAGARF